MTNYEMLLYKILGPVRVDVRPLALAIDLTGELLFVRHFPLDRLRVTKHIYPNVARSLGKTPSATSKSIERLTRICWESLVEQELVTYYLGRAIKCFPSPHRLIVYLAVYSSLNIPFFVMVDAAPQNTLGTLSELEARIIKAIQRAVPAVVTEKIVVRFCIGRTSFPVCPACEVTLEREWQNFCDRCGQCLDWKLYNYARAV